MPGRLAIIQARISSSRLPGKVLKKISEKEILGHMADRLSRCRNIDQLLVATTTNSVDDRIVEYLRLHHPAIYCFRGDEENVLDRYYRAASTFQPKLVIRLTSDSPLVDPDLVDFVISVAETNGYDYVSNSLMPTMPDGLDVECMQMQALTSSWLNAALPQEQEHVTPYIRMRPHQFRLANVSLNENNASLCWAIDTPDDLLFARALSEHIDLLDPRNFGFDTILKLLRKRPELAEINSGSVRDHKLITQLPQIFSAHGFYFDDYRFVRGPGNEIPVL
jgi:spore coat polysaccharide biosynthesis protein SpsF